MQVVNLPLLKHPLNWLVIWSMVFILAFVAHLLISYFSGKHPGSAAANVAGPGTTVTP